MAFALLNDVQRPVERVFKDRVELAQVRDYDLQNYRFPRRVIAEFVAVFPCANFLEQRICAICEGQPVDDETPLPAIGILC